MVNIHRILLLTLVCVVTGCQPTQVDSAAGGSRPSESPSKHVSAAPAPQAVTDTGPRERAQQAKQLLFERLSTRLIQAKSSGGPVAAIHTCSKEASTIAQQVSQELGLQIGRTSFRLRNPNNAPPQWTQTYVEQRAAEPVFVDLPEGHTGAMFPIRIMPQCLGCHGDKDKLAPPVQGALAELYPDDQATGFQLDDLRGWFWVDVPPTNTGDNT